MQAADEENTLLVHLLDDWKLDPRSRGDPIRVELNVVCFRQRLLTERSDGAGRN